MTKDFLAIIPARGGSKRIINKNLINIAGKPLVNWTIQWAKSSKFIDQIVLTSDNENLLKIANHENIYSIKRPKYLSKDNSSSIDVIKHVLNKYNLKNKFKNFIFLQPTSPLRDNFDIDNAIKKFNKKKTNSLISLSKVDNKYLKSFFISNDENVKPAFNNKFPFYPQQKLPNLYISNGAIYIVNINYFLKSSSLISNKTVPYLMSSLKSIDIDDFEDLNKAKKELSRY